jgi:hypothetical protein
MEKLSLTDLRIGNFLKWKSNDSIFEVTLDLFCNKAFQKHVENGDIVGIPLTSEILLACGFENRENLGKGWFKDNVEYWFTDDIHSYYYGITIQSRCQHGQFIFLHQLQNLHYMMSGKEIEFKTELK